MTHCSQIKEKMAEIKKEDPALFYILNRFCEKADKIDKNGDAASAIISFLDFVPQQEELKVQCYTELYNKLNQFLFRNSSSTKTNEFVQECDDYRKNFYSIKQLPLYYQCVKEFLMGKVADQDIKEAISEFIDINSEEEDTENIYSTLLLRVVDFNIGSISKEAFIKILKSPIILQDNVTPRHVVTADANITAQLTTAPIAVPVKKHVSAKGSETYHSYLEDIVFSPIKKEPEFNGKQEAKYMEYIDSSKEEGEMKFLNAGKDWIRNCESIHLIIDNEDKTFLEWIDLFKPSLQSREYTIKIESSLDDIYTSMAEMTDTEKALFMMDFIAVMKIRLANKLGLTELTQEQTAFIENSIALVSQHAFGYKMQAELCAALIKNNLAIAGNGKNHVVTVDIGLEPNVIILIEKGFFALKDTNKISYIGKTKFEPNADSVKATNFVRNFSATDKFLYEHIIEPAVVLMSEDAVIKKRRALISDHKFILERKHVLSTLGSFLEELKNNPEQENKAKINSNKDWLKLKLYRMQNALLFISEDKNNFFIQQRNLVLEQIEDPKSLQDLEILDNFFSTLYIELGGGSIDCPSYHSIEAQVAEIKTSLESDSISERDLLTARKKILDFNHYIFPNRSVALETLICSLDEFRKKHFEPKRYFRIEDRKPVPLQEDSAVALGKEKKRLEQKSLPAVHSGASTSVIRRRKDTVSMFSPGRNTIKGDKVSSTPPVSTPQQKRKSREKEVAPSDLYTFRSFMG